MSATASRSSGSFSSRASSRSSTSSKATIESGLSNASTNSDTVRVIVRCRPLGQQEAERRERVVVGIEGRDTIKLSTVASGGVSLEKKFRFNAVMGAECTQQQFFEQCGIRALLDSAMDGYAATVFAYGQTGSGKTYSMSGYEEKIAGESYSGDVHTDGLIPRSMSYIFNKIQQAKNNPSQGNGSFRVKASYCEIYNEQVYDLLNLTNHQSLQVRWNQNKGFFVQDLYLVECSELMDVMEVVSEGHRNRRVGSHEMNKDSSRSHSILTLHVESESIDPDDGHLIVKFGKIVFVDLAGSERLKDTKSEGVTKTETGAINKSLFTLSNVISALSSPNAGLATNNHSVGSQSHIPYRDSKLTKLLMDSLGGTSLTLMIACCSPASSFLEETINTLKYATRAGKIKNKPTIQLDGKEQLIARLRNEVKLLKMENDMLRQQMGSQHQSPHNRNGVVRTPTGSLPSLNPSLPPGLGIQAVPPINQQPPNSSGSGRTSPKSALIHKQQQQKQHQPYYPNSSVDNVIGGYQKEIHRLKSENRDVRTREVIAQRSFHNAMTENEVLQKKLEHLEQVFVHDSNDTSTPSSYGKARAPLRQADLTTENQKLEREVEQLRHLLQKAATNKEGEVVKALRGENEHLNQVVRQLQQREKALMSALKQVEWQKESTNIIEEKIEEGEFLFD